MGHYFDSDSDDDDDDGGGDENSSYDNDGDDGNLGSGCNDDSSNDDYDFQVMMKILMMTILAVEVTRAQMTTIIVMVTVKTG